MNYLLDTCTISELVKNRPDKNVVKWIEECDEDTLFLSVLTIGEIQKGISKLRDKRRKVKIQRWLDSDLKSRFADRILPISKDVALAWGVLEGEAQLIGQSIPVMDAVLGATALVYNLTVVTRNIDDVKPTGVRILNPWTL